ncbi:HupE/UreJ family protein [Flagellimonas allohymeniacidonis]|uniref:HupE/UreJ family protein n=1 Tax=Flagellimonas allohymeniacidonis TaxID=2517819 RepID=A0A4Q8QFR5_9FLAO|nr:HupE/UreJ family protein [Allomuricauda hymeniacidonis]TAI47403.1 HupE/UreJ family protein [Allomuricauda hymeniacidonis]
MQDFWFYIKLGFNHVLDFGAYDHILFLAALATPFTFKHWKRVVILATIFTIAHCTSLALAAFDVMTVDVGLIEFLIPVTILLTALFNFIYVFRDAVNVGMYLHVLVTAFFGLIHGFGFSNYFKMLMADQEDKIVPLLGFATGIEFSQVAIIMIVLAIAFLVQSILRVKRSHFIISLSILICVITIPLLYNTLLNLME